MKRVNLTLEDVKNAKVVAQFKIPIPEKCPKCSNEKQTIGMYLYGFAERGLFFKKRFVVFKCLVCDNKILKPLLTSFCEVK